MDRELTRVQRLIELREREQSAEVAAVRRAQSDEATALANEEAARAELVRADQQRQNLAATPSSVQEYIALDDWLETLAIRHAAARQRLAQAKAVVRRVQLKLKAAQTRLKQAELLKERLELARHKVAVRRERKVEDEIAQRIASNSQESRDT